MFGSNADISAELSDHDLELVRPGPLKLCEVSHPSFSPRSASHALSSPTTFTFPVVGPGRILRYTD